MRRTPEFEDLIVLLGTAGVADETIGHVSADIGDLEESLEIIVRQLWRIARGEEVTDAIDALESEVHDHMPGHVTSLGQLPARLREALRITD